MTSEFGRAPGGSFIWTNMEFQGTLLLVSHDRAFLDSVVTSTLVFEGNGLWCEYEGGYQDWLRQRKPDPTPQAVKHVTSRAGRPEAPARRVGYKERRELGELPKRIETLEAEGQVLFELMASPTFYARPGPEIGEAGEQLTALEGRILKAYARWMELEGASTRGDE